MLYSMADRDLGLAGRVLTQREGKLESHLLHINKALMRAPNLAIHLDREVNTRGLIVNPQQHLPPVFGLAAHAPVDMDALRSWMSRGLGFESASPSDLVAFDLSLPHSAADQAGYEDEFTGRVSTRRLVTPARRCSNHPANHRTPA
jgi:aspartyl aminopeptidase